MVEKEWNAMKKRNEERARKIIIKAKRVLLEET